MGHFGESRGPFWHHFGHLEALRVPGWAPDVEKNNFGGLWRVYKVVYKESPCKRGLNIVYKGVVINRLVDSFSRGLWLILL